MSESMSPRRQGNGLQEEEDDDDGAATAEELVQHYMERVSPSPPHSYHLLATYY